MAAPDPPDPGQAANAAEPSAQTSGILSSKERAESEVVAELQKTGGLAGTAVRGGQLNGERSDEEDDADDVDFNPLFLRESEEEESDEEELEEDPSPAPLPQQALLDEGRPAAPPPSLPPCLHSPGGRSAVPPLGPFSPGQSAFHPFGVPLSFSPSQSRGLSNGSFDLPASMQAAPESGDAAAERGEEAVDGPAKRTRAQVSLAELTWEELDTFLQDDEDDFFPGIDDDEEYARFLASISALDELPEEGAGAVAGTVARAGEDDEDDDDQDFVAEEEPEDEDDDAQPPQVGRRRMGRPRGSCKKPPPDAHTRAAALRRPLAIKPATLEGRYQQMMWHVPSHDGRLRPVLMLKPVAAPPPPPPTMPRFTANQVGQLFCQLHEHVQLLLQLYCLTCLGPPPSRALAAQCKAFLEALATARERVLRDKQTAFPERCFQPPCAAPSLHPHRLVDGLLTVAPWAPSVDGPVRSLLDVKPLRAVGAFLRDMALVIAEIDRKFPPGQGQSIPRALLKPLFPPTPNSRPPQKPSETIRSILTNQHNPAPLPGDIWDRTLLGQPLESTPPDTNPGCEGAYGFHSVLLAEPVTDVQPVEQPRPLFVEDEGMPDGAPPAGDAAATTSVEGQPPRPGAVVARGQRGEPRGIGEELAKAAKPTLVGMARVAPIVSDLVHEAFHDALNPALYPRDPPPTARPKVFSEAEDELLALGIQEFNSDWERIRERFLPTKTVQQIVIRVKNRCSSSAPDNVIKQMRHRKAAPLSAQEKFFLDDGILHHGYDWRQLAAYVPRADPALLPKLYRQACGVKPKCWKASQGRNERRRKQRQHLASQRARQEAAAELRELATDAPQRPSEPETHSSGTESDTPPERGEDAAPPAVRGLFLEEAATQEPPAPPDPAVFQHPPGAPAVVQAPIAPASVARPFWTTGMASQQPAAKRRKGDPAPGRGQGMVPIDAAHRPLARPPLRPLATQALPFPGPRALPPRGNPIMLPPGLLKPSHPGGPFPTASDRQPSTVVQSSPPAPPNPPSSSQAPRTIVFRPQARRVTPMAAVSHAQAPAGLVATPPGRGTGAGRPAEARPRAPPTAVTQLRGPARPGQGPLHVKPPTLSSAPLPTMAASLKEPRPPGAVPLPVASEPLPAPSVNGGGPTPPALASIIGTAQQTGPASAPENRQISTLAQTRTAPLHATLQDSASAAAHRVAQIVAPVSQAPARARAPVPTVPAPSSPKPWKTRQRQPKAVKAQQKAKEAEERRRKQEAKGAEKRSMQESQRAGQGPAAAESTVANGSTAGKGPAAQSSVPRVTVHKQPHARGNGVLAPNGTTRITHIATGHGSLGVRPHAPGVPPSCPPAQPVALRQTRHEPRPPFSPHQHPLASAGVPGPIRPPSELAQQPFSLPNGYEIQARESLAVHAAHTPAGSVRPAAEQPFSRTGLFSSAAPQGSSQHCLPGGSMASLWGSEGAQHSGGVPLMEQDELTDSDEEHAWQPNGSASSHLGGRAAGRGPANYGAFDHSPATVGDVAGEQPPERGHAGLEAGQRGPLGAAMGARGAPGAEMREVEMERDELTDSDDDGEQGAAQQASRRGGAAGPVPEVEMEQDELTDSEEEADSGGDPGGPATQDVVRGFLMEQDELTESDEEADGREREGRGSGLHVAGDLHLDGRESGVASSWGSAFQGAAVAEPTVQDVQAAGQNSSGQDCGGTPGELGLARRVSVTFEKDELEDSNEEKEDGRGPAGGFEQDQVTESDDDLLQKTDGV